MTSMIGVVGRKDAVSTWAVEGGCRTGMGGGTGKNASRFTR